MFTASLLLAYALLGFAVLHAITTGIGGRGFMLTGLYLTVGLFGWPIVLMALRRTDRNHRRRCARAMPRGAARPCHPDHAIPSNPNYNGETNMEVILLERVAKLGQMGEVVRVKDGFARNFLLPQGKALRATKDNRTKFEGMKAQLEARNLELKKDAEGVAGKLNGKSFVVLRQASDIGQLYGSVSARDIAAILTDGGFTVDAQPDRAACTRSRRSACTRSRSRCIRKSRSRSRSMWRAMPTRRSARRAART